MRRRALVVGGGLMVTAAMAGVAAVIVDTPGSDPVPEFAGARGPFRWEATPEPAPDLRFTTADGAGMHLSDLRGRLVLLNLWATWCPPCVKEMPSLDRLQARFGGDGFTVVALSLDATGQQAVAPFFAKAGLTALTPYLDPEGVSMATLKPRGLPTSYLIDRAGRILGRLEGEADWDSPAAASLIRGLLDRPAQG